MDFKGAIQHWNFESLLLLDYNLLEKNVVFINYFFIPGIILHFSNFTFLDWLICDDQIYSSWIPLYFRNTSWSNQILYFCLGALGSFIHGSTLHLSQKPEFEGVRTFGPRLLAPVETDSNDIFSCMISPLDLQEYMSVCT